MSRKGTARQFLKLSYLGTKLRSTFSIIQFFCVFKDTKEVILRKPFSLNNRHYLTIQCKDRTSTIIVGGRVGRSRSWKYFGHHGWPTEKILDFQWPKTVQMALKFLCFSQNILNFFQDFSGKLRKFQFKMKPCRPCINFYIKSFSDSTNTAVISLYQSI